MSLRHASEKCVFLVFSIWESGIGNSEQPVLVEAVPAAGLGGL